MIDEETTRLDLLYSRGLRSRRWSALRAIGVLSLLSLFAACGGEEGGTPEVLDSGADSGALSDAGQKRDGAGGGAGAVGTGGAPGAGGTVMPGDGAVGADAAATDGTVGTGGSVDTDGGTGGSVGTGGTTGTGGSVDGGEAGSDASVYADAADVYAPDVADAAGPQLAINHVTITEGSSGTPQAVFTVSLTPSASAAVTVSYTTSDGTATAPSDYTTTAGTLTFAPGETAKTIAVPVVGDAIDEANEDFSVVLSNPTGAALSAAQGTGTVTDDDGPPALTINDVTVGEGNTGTTAATFTISLSTASGQPVSVAFATANGTATAGANDFATSSGTLTFAPGETSKTLTVSVAGDELDEIDETFSVQLSNPTNATLADGTGTGTITDDDSLPSLSVNSVSVPEGNTATTTMTFTVALSTASGRVVTVAYATQDESAAAGSDYTAATGTLTFQPGETSKTVSVSVTGDVTEESDDTFALVLSNPGAASIATDRGRGTILNDDTGNPIATIADAEITEGNSGPVAATLMVTLSASSTQTITIDWTTADGTAIAGTDYTAASGTLTFAPGETSKTLSVPVLGDLLDEVDETLSVNLAGAVHASLARAQATCTIRDDDAVPTLAVNDVSVTEGAAGATVAAFTVSLSAPSGNTVTVGYATADGSAKSGGSTAVGENDYAAAAAQLSFAPGTTSQLVIVSINGDTLNEGNENFSLNLSGAVNAGIADGQGVCTITNDDPLPALSINDFSLVEGSASTTNAVFTVTLSAPSGRDVGVNFGTAAGSATVPSDFATTVGRLTFNPGQTTQTISVPVVGDLADEPNETFSVGLSSPANATLSDDQGTCTIVNDDSARPTLNINDVSIAEGNTGTTQAVLTVILSSVSSDTVTVNYATADGTASAGTDYTAASGTITFAPGETVKLVSVAISGDALNESNETILVNLSNASAAAVIGDGQGMATINNDDAAPTLSINDATVLEGNAATSSVVLTVSLSHASGQPVTVNYASVDETATSSGTGISGGSDYVGVSGSLVFAPGETSKTISLGITGDLLNELDETFQVRLSGAVNASMADAAGTVTITNDDAEPTVSIADIQVSEGNMMSKQVRFQVSLSAASGRVITLDYATVQGTATAPLDYQATTGSLRFGLGDTTQAINVTINGDRTAESDEAFYVTLSNLVNASFAHNQGQCTILNDD